MKYGQDWRNRSGSKRRKFVSVISMSQESFRAQSIGRARQCYHFFADFWESTPHPIAQMSLVMGWATMVVTVNDANVLDANLTLDSTAGRTLTTILAFLIVFRTNQSYNRWWEGRILWGKMHWSCVELAQQAASWIENPQLAVRIMNFAIAHAYTVKQCLRREHLNTHDLEGIVDAAEVVRVNKMSLQVVPYYCTDVIRQCIKKGLTDNPQTFGAQAVARGLDIPVSQLSVQFADMARVRDTPQPACFRVMLHMFTVVYLLMLPIISYESLGYWVLPEVLLTSYLMLGLQLAATHLEDPFGYDLSDLDLDLYVANIAKHCREAFYVGDKGGIDLTLHDGGAGADRTGSPGRGVGDTVGCRGGRQPTGGSRGSRGSRGTNGTNGGGNSGEAERFVSDGWRHSPSPDTSAPASLSPGGTVRGSDASFGGRGRGGESDKTPSPPQPPPQTHAEEDLSCLSGDPFGLTGGVAMATASPVIITEIMAPVGGGSELSRGRSGYRSRERSRDRSEAKSGPGSDSSSRPPSFSGKKLSIRHRAQEDVAPRRRSKSRPGRGKAPLGEEEGSVATPPPPPIDLQQYNFETQETSLRADVV